MTPLLLYHDHKTTTLVRLEDFFFYKNTFRRWILEVFHWFLRWKMMAISDIEIILQMRIIYDSFNILATFSWNIVALSTSFFFLEKLKLEFRHMTTFLRVYHLIFGTFQWFRETLCPCSIMTLLSRIIEHDFIFLSFWHFSHNIVTFKFDLSS